MIFILMLINCDDIYQIKALDSVWANLVMTHYKKNCSNLKLMPEILNLMISCIHSNESRVELTRKNQHARVAKQIDTQTCGNDTFLSVILTRSSMIYTRRV
jgi:hypothetical protein